MGHDAALLLAERHCGLLLVARRESLLRELAERCVEKGAPVADVMAIDLAQYKEAGKVVEQASAHPSFNRRCLINGAGIAEFSDATSFEWRSVERQFAINFMAPLGLIQSAIPWMLAGAGGVIVNVLSIVVQQVFPNAAVYSGSKAALYAAGRSVAAEYRKKGIQITNFLPGAVDTPIWDQQPFKPNRSDMIPSLAAAEVIRDLVLAPPDRAIDEMILMPPKGVL